MPKLIESGMEEKNKIRKSIFALPWGLITFLLFLSAVAMAFVADRCVFDPCRVLDPRTPIGFFQICMIVFWTSGIIALVFTMVKRKMDFSSIFPVIAIFVLLSAIAAPNIKRYQAKPKTCDATVNLRLLYEAQSNYYLRHQQYAKTFKELGWSVEKLRCNQHCWYRIFLSPQEILEPGFGVVYPLPPGIEASVSGQEFQIVAVGNIDNDATLDIWSINEKGELKNLVNDIKQ